MSLFRSQIGGYTFDGKLKLVLGVLGGGIIIVDILLFKILIPPVDYQKIKFDLFTVLVINV
jgi:hypothetical protein